MLVEIACPLRITFRVAEPEGLARRLPLLANGVTDQGLGEVSAANEAGNPVLGAVELLPVRWFDNTSISHYSLYDYYQPRRTSNDQKPLRR